MLVEVDSVPVSQGGDPPLDVGSDGVINEDRPGAGGGSEALGGKNPVCERSARPDHGGCVKESAAEAGQLVLSDLLVQLLQEGGKELVEREGDSVGLQIKLRAQSNADRGRRNDMILRGGYFKPKAFAEHREGIKLEF